MEKKHTGVEVVVVVVVVVYGVGEGAVGYL
jgi:hypothetical protein